MKLLKGKTEYAVADYFQISLCINNCEKINPSAKITIAIISQIKVALEN